MNNEDSKKSGYLFRSVIVCAILLILIAQVFQISFYHRIGKNTGLHTLNADQMKRYAAKLATVNLTGQAQEAYEKYLILSGADDAHKANVYYTVAEMLYKKELLEEALAYYYKAEIADPKTPLAGEISARIVNCLERLGLSYDAKAVLDSRTKLPTDGTDGADQSKLIVARIGERSITMDEVNDTVEQLPSFVRKQMMDSPQRQIEFVQSYVVTELLYEKGTMLGLNKDKDILRDTEEFRKQSIAKKTIDFEFKQRVQVNDDVIKIYYDANKDRYAQPPRAKIRHIVLSGRAEAANVLERLKAGEDFEKLARAESIDDQTKAEGGTVTEWIWQGDFVAHLGQAPAINDRIFDTSAGERDIVEHQGNYHVFEVIEKYDREVLPYNRISGKVRFDYEQESRTKLMDQIIHELITRTDVEIYKSKIVEGFNR